MGLIIKNHTNQLEWFFGKIYGLQINNRWIIRNYISATVLYLAFHPMPEKSSALLAHPALSGRLYTYLALVLQCLFLDRFS
ncbi:hypothetical protein SAMN05216243_1110 [Sediminibacillus albus]|uniref:Uncharacterized protein n=1 Tax=Sediminibacillus albus TaxID=407036 RepID=A0A1G8X204_9BACI|nr:hypothetical protein SAMN05216243_1110 [Sediminibacillus albus]